MSAAAGRVAGKVGAAASKVAGKASETGGKAGTSDGVLKKGAKRDPELYVCWLLRPPESAYAHKPVLTDG